MKNDKDDITIDSNSDIDDSVVAEESLQETVKKLREKLKKVEAEKQEYLDGWQRAKADFVNIRKRDEDAKQEFLKFSKEEIVRDVIPVLDSFELAFRDKKVWEGLPKDWRTGVESIYNQLLAILTNHGVKKVVPVGEVFDPKQHEAVNVVRVDDKNGDEKIIDVLQAGYSLFGKEIRSAKVVVGKYGK